jgi:hypothetical protein
MRGCQRQGAEGIAQFMPRTASWHGLADPFDPIDSLRHSAAYLRELLNRFGNLGLAAAAYNAGPARVSAWLTSHRPLPGETRNYVALVTGWTADEWASSAPPEKADTTIPQGVPCTRLANLILAPKQERQRIAAYVPRWGIQLAAHLSESAAWSSSSRFPCVADRTRVLVSDRIRTDPLHGVDDAVHGVKALAVPESLMAAVLEASKDQRPARDCRSCFSWALTLMES